MPLVFISYSRDDQRKVLRLAEALRQRGDIHIWIDTERILPGDDIVEEMKKGVLKADKILICLSPAFDARPPTSWVKKELKMAILKENKVGKLMIIPIRIEKGGTVPEELGTKAYADLSTKKRWKRNLPRLIQAIRREG
jgi:hypothetical protein